MDVQVTLLGQPSISRGGERVLPPKGRKPWALLAYLALAERPPTRQRVAGLLFGEADDPMAALRWNLAELRRALGNAEILRGDPIEQLRDGASIDVDVLSHGQWTDAITLDGLGRDLLEGMEFGAAPAFDAWLLTTRRHLRALASSMLHEAGLALVASGEYAAAIDASAQLVELDPFDENAQTLLVRSLAASGDRAGAQARVRMCTKLFQRELGIEPSAGLRLAAEVSPGTSTLAAVGGRPAVRAQLEAGEAAIAAGAVEAGLQCLRRAAAEAEACADEDLLARSSASAARSCTQCAGETSKAQLHCTTRSRSASGPAPAQSSHPRVGSSASSTSNKAVTSEPSCGSRGPRRSRAPTWRSSHAWTASAAWRCPTRLDTRRRSRPCTGRSSSRTRRTRRSRPRGRCPFSVVPISFAATTSSRLLRSTSHSVSFRGELDRLPAVAGGSERRTRVARWGRRARRGGLRPRVRARVPDRRPLLARSRGTRCRPHRSRALVLDQRHRASARRPDEMQRLTR